MSRPTRAVLFDCYGTILDIADDRGATRRYAALARGADGPSPMTSPITLDAALRARGVTDRRSDDLAADVAAEAAGVRPIGNAVEVLAAVMESGCRVAIVSNLSMEYAEPIARLLPGVPLVASFETGLSKPDPRIYHTALRWLGVQAHEALMIGDSLRCDHDGAIAAGMSAVLIGTSRRPDVRKAADVGGALEKAGFGQGGRICGRD